jgi:hypothetical protein
VSQLKTSRRLAQILAMKCKRKITNRSGLPIGQVDLVDDERFPFLVNGENLRRFAADFMGVL